MSPSLLPSLPFPHLVEAISVPIVETTVEICLGIQVFPVTRYLASYVQSQRFAVVPRRARPRSGRRGWISILGPASHLAWASLLHHRNHTGTAQNSWNMCLTPDLSCLREAQLFGPVTQCSPFDYKRR